MKSRHDRRNALRLTAAAGLLILVSSAAVPAYAQIVPAECRANDSSGNPNPNFPGSCTICHIGVMTVNFTTFLMEKIAFPAAVLLITIGGLTLLTAGPSEGQRTTGKKIITTTVMGLIIILVAWIAVDTTIKVLTGKFNFTGPPGILIQSFGPWNHIDLSRGCPIG